MFNTITPDATSEGLPRMMIIIFLVYIHTYMPPPAASAAVGGSYFGHGNLSILLGYTICYGSESQVANCSGVRYQYPIPRSCDNTHVAGVRCFGKCNPWILYKYFEWFVVYSMSIHSVEVVGIYTYEIILAPGISPVTSKLTPYPLNSVIYRVRLRACVLVYRWSDILLSCSSCIETTKILGGQLDVRCTTCRCFD